MFESLPPFSKAFLTQRHSHRMPACPRREIVPRDEVGVYLIASRGVSAGPEQKALVKWVAMAFVSSVRSFLLALSAVLGRRIDPLTNPLGRVCFIRAILRPSPRLQRAPARRYSHAD